MKASVRLGWGHHGYLLVSGGRRDRLAMQDVYDWDIRTAERMIRAGATFEQVEEYVDGLELGEKEKTVVWLMAWAILPRPERLRIIERSQAGIKVR